MLKNKDLDKNSDYKMTEKEKKDIMNELELLLNNPNVSIDESLKNLIKKNVIEHKKAFPGINEANWYKIAQKFIRDLKKKEIKLD